MLGTNIGGDLASIGTLAQWLRDTSMKVDRAADTMRRMRETAYEHWTDDAGEYFAEQLRIGEKNAHNMVDALQRLARLISDCYDDLARAQELMTEAEQVALSGGLTVRDHIIIPPTTTDRPSTAAPIYDADQLRSWYHLRHETYHQAENLVERACQILLDLLDRLTDQSDWSTLYFTLGDITRGELEYWTTLKQQGLGLAAEESTKRALQASRDIEWHSKHALRTEKWLPVDQAINRKLSAQELARTYTVKAGNLGMVAKVLNKGGPVLLISGLLWDIYAEDDPAVKAILSSSAGLSAATLATGALSKLARLGFFASGPQGVAIGIILSGAAAYVVSDATGYAYDQVEPAREKLLRWSGDLDTKSVNIRTSQHDVKE